MTEFETIYRACFGDVYRYLCRLTGNAHTAEEITSETFFKAMKAYPRFRGHCDVRVWLCQIAKNTYYSARRSSARLAPLDADAFADTASPDVPVDERIIRRDEADMLRAVVHEIPQPYQEVFMWRVFAELPFREIGRQFGKTENWACVTYHRARAMLQKRLEEKQHEE